jgi:hypothetical protein
VRVQVAVGVVRFALGRSRTEQLEDEQLGRCDLNKGLIDDNDRVSSRLALEP